MRVLQPHTHNTQETHVHDDVYPRLTELYEHDYLFDRFEVVTNHSGSEIYTGSYRGEFVQFDSQQGSKVGVVLLCLGLVWFGLVCFVCLLFVLPFCLCTRHCGTTTHTASTHPTAVHDQHQPRGSAGAD